MSDLAAGGIALELGNRERCRAGDHAVDGEPPVGECSFLKAPEGFGLGGLAICEWSLRNLAVWELTGQRVARQHPLRSICQCFSAAVVAPLTCPHQTITPLAHPSNRRPP